MIKSLFVSLLFFAQIPFPGPGRAPAGGGGGGIVHVQTVCGNGSNGAACPAGTGTVPATTVQTSITVSTGNTVIVGISSYNTVTVTGVSDGTNSYTLDVSEASTGQGRTAIYRAVNVTGGTYTITATFSGSAYAVIFASEFSGLSASGNPECSGTGQASAVTSITTTDCVTTTANTMLYAIWAQNSGGGTITATAGAGYTIPTDGLYTNAGHSNASAVEYKIVSSSGTHNGTFTISTASGGSSAVAGYK